MKKLFLICFSVLFACTAFLFACNDNTPTGDGTADGNTEEDNDSYEKWVDDEWDDNLEIAIEATTLSSGYMRTPPETGYYCGYRASEIQFDIDAVRIYFIFGSVIRRYLVANNWYGIEFWDSTPRNPNQRESIRIRNISLEDFCVGYNPSTALCIKRTKYFTIPEQLFKYKEGRVGFSFREEYQKQNGEVERGSGSSISIYYKKENNKITISTTSFEEPDYSDYVE